MSNFADRILAQLDPGDLKRVRAGVPEAGGVYECLGIPLWGGGFYLTIMADESDRSDVIDVTNGFPKESLEEKPWNGLHVYALDKGVRESPEQIAEFVETHTRRLRPEIAFRQVVRAITGEFGWSVERLKKEWSK